MEDLSDSGGVGNHASTAGHLGQVTSGNGGGGLVVDTALETGGTPIDELDGPLGLDGGDGSRDFLGDDVSTVHQTGGHVLALAGFALDEHVLLLKESVGELGDGVSLVEGVLGAVDGGVGSQQKVDPGVGHQVDLELVDVNVQGSLETERSSQRRNNLGNEPVEVVVGRALDAEGVSADVVDGFVVQHESDISVLQKGVGGQDTVVGLDNTGGEVGRGVDAEIQLGLLSIVNRQSLQQQRTETRSSSTTNGVEDQEPLQGVTLVSQLTDLVKSLVEKLFSDGVVSSGVVVSGILLASDHLRGVEKLAVFAGANFVNDRRLQINKDGTGNVLAIASLVEEGRQGVGRLGSVIESSIFVNFVLKAVQLPASSTKLNTSLSNVKGNNLAHVGWSVGRG